MAERVGFEPTVRFPARSLSRRVLSTAQPPLRGRSRLNRSRADCFSAIGRLRRVTRKSPIKGNVKRNASPSARCRYFVRHSAQLFERALSIREWSCSGRVAYFVPACEAQERFLFPVVPYPCCDG